MAFGVYELHKYSILVSLKSAVLVMVSKDHINRTDLL
jgi:hypothetical protein